MHRAIPAMLLSATGFVVVWQFEPSAALAPLTITPPVPAASAADTVPGSVEITWRGAVQVAVVFTEDRIADVRVLQAPDSAPTRMALPILREEVLRAQSADIDTVSGATITSEAYSRSLQFALDHKP
ncbi:FMN-binding protein [Lentzea tibetensis]|uniref:FMN-binding protein n=1 Tax=Lentzea tibetensis TaxID=2591470 RepID=A0A563EVW8_9PSEU|nr:FMN-binding protein [Lentzea tibetensis]TWP51857.1 FMN-binding protein [Lentzea tibetensis]